MKKDISDKSTLLAAHGSSVDIGIRQKVTPKHASRPRQSGSFRQFIFPTTTYTQTQTTGNQIDYGTSPLSNAKSSSPIDVSSSDDEAMNNGTV